MQRFATYKRLKAKATGRAVFGTLFFALGLAAILNYFWPHSGRPWPIKITEHVSIGTDG